MIGIVKGLLTTLSTFSRKPVTIQYPDEKHVLPVRERSFPVLLWDFEHNEPMCTGCNICVRNCPVDCMTAEMMDNPQHPDNSDKRKVVSKFWIDYARCMRCNICVEVCPFDAIVMDNNWSGHEHSVYDRLDLHLDLDDLLREHREGRLRDVFFPQDNIAVLDAKLKGEDPPELKGQATRPTAFEEFMEKVKRGEAELAPVYEPTQAAAAPAAAPAQQEGEQPKGDPMSPQKQRARRMKAEREAKTYAEEASLAGDVAERFVKRSGELGRLGLGAEDAVERAKGELEADTLPEDGIGEPPADLKGGPPTGDAQAAAPAAGGAAPKGDPMSPQKQRARRMKAEREAKTYVEEASLAEDVAERFVKRSGELGRLGLGAEEAVERVKGELEADTLPEDGIGEPPADLGGGGGGAAAPAAAGGGGAPADAGPKGDPMSPQKQRARRMRAERRAKEVAEERGLEGEELEKLVEAAGELGRKGDGPDEAVEKALAEIGGGA